VGFDRQSWFPRLVYHHLESEYGVHYSLRHIRRLLREAGVTWRTARPTRSEGDPEEVAEVQDTLNTTNAN
jgi:transposase